MRAVTAVALFGIAIPVIAGCTRGEDRVTVAGQITVDGVPLSDAQIIFYPIDGEMSRAFASSVDAQGHYELSESGSNSDGVPPGKYRVSISTAILEGPVDEFSVTPPERVPAKYRDTLEFEVPADGTTEANFNLES